MACLLKCKAIVSGKTCSRYLKRLYVVYLLFLPQGMLTISFLSCSFWIAHCHQGMRNHNSTTSPLLPLANLLMGKQTTWWKKKKKKKKSSIHNAVPRSASREMGRDKMLQRTMLSLRPSCTAHQWAQASKHDHTMMVKYHDGESKYPS